MKALRRFWIRVINYILDPFCDVEFDKNDVPIITFYIRR